MCTPHRHQQPYGSKVGPSQRGKEDQGPGETTGLGDHHTGRGPTLSRTLQRGVAERLGARRELGARGPTPGEQGDK